MDYVSCRDLISDNAKNTIKNLDETMDSIRQILDCAEVNNLYKINMSNKLKQLIDLRLTLCELR